MLRSITLLFVIALTALQPAAANNVETWGERSIHFIAFNSTFLTPSVARSYGIERSRYRALINISVIDKQSSEDAAIPVQIKGEARNLLGNRVELNFREIREESAIYYIASIGFSNEEMFRFSIDITDKNGQTKQLTFEQKFYAD